MRDRKRVLLDSWAMLALLNDEAGADVVADRLHDAERTGVPLLINDINVGEVYYVVGRHRSLDAAERVMDHLRILPLEFVANDLEAVVAAARWKARYRISYADAFAAATADRFGATILTGDPEFEALGHRVEVEWIGG